MSLPDHWTDLDRALFLLDGAEQSIVDEFHAPSDPDTMQLLGKFRDRITQLRRESAEWSRNAR